MLDLRCKPCHLLLLTILVNTGSGYSFDPNCAIPPEGSNLVLSPNIRGTFEILWSSVFTILSCTWTVQHLNIPFQDPLPRKTAWAKTRGIARSLWVKVKWMLTTIMLPEFLVGKALQDRYRANSPNSILEDIAIKSGFRWTKTHSFYADMGGFVLKAKSNYRGEVAPTPVYLNLTSLAYIFTKEIQHATPKENQSRDNQAVDNQAVDNQAGPSNKEKAPAVDSQLEDETTTGYLVYRLPTVTEKDIMDKSKGDTFIKAITMLQVSWSVVQAIARGVRGLDISQLEITVIAYAACSLVTFLLCISKPKDVGVPTIVPVKHNLNNIELTMDDAKYIQDSLPRSWFYITLRLFRYGRTGDLVPDEGHRSVLLPIANDARYDDVPSAIFPRATFLTLMDDGFLVAGLVFGGIHCAAWNFPFPTAVEQLLWRIASLLSAGLLPLFYAVLLYDIHVTEPRWLRLPLPVFQIVFAVGFVLARLFLIVEVFRSLFFLPPSAFVGTWSSHIPHVS